MSVNRRGELGRGYNTDVRGLLVMLRTWKGVTGDGVSGEVEKR